MNPVLHVVSVAAFMSHINSGVGGLDLIQLLSCWHYPAPPCMRVVSTATPNNIVSLKHVTLGSEVVVASQL